MRPHVLSGLIVMAFFGWYTKATYLCVHFPCQEMVHVIHKSKLPVRFKCRMNMGGQNADQQDHILSQFKMTVHVLSDSAFRRYQKEMGYYGITPTVVRMNYLLEICSRQTREEVQFCGLLANQF